MQYSAERLKTSSSSLIVIIGLLFMVLTWPVWRWLWQEWLGNQYYSHGLLIPVVSLFLIVQRTRNDPTFAWRHGQSDPLSLTLLVVSMVAFLYTLNTKAYYLSAFAMLVMLASLVWILGGRVALRKLAFPILYLGFMAPLPFIEKSTLPLAMFTGVCSTGLVQLLGLQVQIVGNAVTLPNADLVIGAQCSGINSLIALTALTTLAAYLVTGSFWRRLLLILSAAPLALLSNILRVSSLLFVARAYGAESAFTFYHDYSGALFFVAALILLYLLALLLRCTTLRVDVI
ncbi:MAG: exosortase/archaeosortase family protein [Caldilineaceae bacterium]